MSARQTAWKIDSVAPARISRFSQCDQVVSSGRWICLDGHVRKERLRRAEQSVARNNVHVPGLGCHATCESEDEVLVGSNGRRVLDTHKSIALRAICAFSMLISPADPRAALARSRATSSYRLRRKSQTTTKQAALHINTLLYVSELKTNIPVTDTYIMFVVRCGL